MKKSNPFNDFVKELNEHRKNGTYREEIERRMNMAVMDIEHDREVDEMSEEVEMCIKCGKNPVSSQKLYRLAKGRLCEDCLLEYADPQRMALADLSRRVDRIQKALWCLTDIMAKIHGRHILDDVEAALKGEKTHEEYIESSEED